MCDRLSIIRDMPRSTPGQLNKRGAPAPSADAPWVHLSVLRGLPIALEQLGVPCGPLLRDFGLSREDFEDPDRVASFAPLDELLQACVQQTGCAHLGLLVGVHVNLQSLGIAGRLALNTRSVGAALQELIAYFALHDNGGVPSLAIHDATASYAYGLHTPGIRSAEQVYDLSAVALRNVLRQLCGPQWRPDVVLLPRRRPADLQPYREILASPIRFDAVQCAVTFPARWLQQPLADADPVLYSLLKERAASVLAEQHPPLRTEVRRVVRLLLAGGECSRAAAAAQLGMHERTLGRRLQEAGTTFQALLDEARCELARQLLGSTRTPVARISTSLGYRDPTVFTRAFRRWTGVTPRQYRGSLGGRQ